MTHRYLLSGLIGVLALFAITMTSTEAQLTGGVTQLSGSQLTEAIQTLKTYLAKLAAGKGPSFTISKVISASSQVVSGIIYYYRVDLIGPKNGIRKCNVELWSQPWLANGIKITFKCPLVRRLSP